jgi:hypothetical protein
MTLDKWDPITVAVYEEIRMSEDKKIMEALKRDNEVADINDNVLANIAGRESPEARTMRIMKETVGSIRGATANNIVFDGN